METSEKDDTPAEEEMVRVEETLEQGLPLEEYGRDSEKLREQMEKPEKEYDQREKVIDRILATAPASRAQKAVRMYPTPILKNGNLAWRVTDLVS
jgi:hypothetical protein